MITSSHQSGKGNNLAWSLKPISVRIQICGVPANNELDSSTHLILKFVYQSPIFIVGVTALRNIMYCTFGFWQCFYFQEDLINVFSSVIFSYLRPISLFHEGYYVGIIHHFPRNHRQSIPRNDCILFIYILFYSLNAINNTFLFFSS